MAYNPVVTPQSLSQLGNVPLYATLDAARWLREGQQADAQGLADLSSMYQHQQAMRPLEREKTRLSNETTLAQLPGFQADSSMKQRKNELEAFTFDKTKEAAIAKLANEMSAEDIRSIELQAQKLMYGTPQERQRGEALMIASKSMLEMKKKHEYEMEQQRERSRSAAEVATIGANSRVNAAQISAAARAALIKGMSPKDLVGKITNQLLTETDPAIKAQLQADLEFATAIADRYQPIPAVGVDPNIAPGTLVRPTQPPIPKAPNGGIPSGVTTSGW